ncbi:ER lumen protein retaining receptor [Tetrabaena socialis]|uniref:Clathrin light chain n=1 Tax=Tetrabaena socialis TaxID=47790 RepID=A0A2J7ZZF7_9CHLO|nr:ER lumen protein retaining receptor [Tetrabaena socialis]|eukprot:PNH05643.1 ER lumen protein retaining receptor [Tetrabaena socialis]
MLSMETALAGGGLLHALSRTGLLWKLARDKNCRAISLVTLELYFIIYVTRYLDLLYMFSSFSSTLFKLIHLVVAMAIVLLMRYSPAAQTYDADLDVFPRIVLIAPCLVLAVFLNRVNLIVEIFHSFRFVAICRTGLPLPPPPFQAAPSDSFAAAPSDSFAAAPPAPMENGAGLDDFFSGSAAVLSPSSTMPAAAEAALFADSAPAAADTAEGDVTFADGAAPPADEEAFFQHYEPTPLPAPVVPAEVVDPRVEWRKVNQETLKKKDAEEAGAKKQLKEGAAKHLEKFYTVRTATLTTRKGNNRKSEAHQKEVEVPASGTVWEKVNALVNFASTKDHAKDVTRYKALLLTCKAKNRKREARGAQAVCARWPAAVARGVLRAEVVTDWEESVKEDPYAVLADVVHAVVFLGGLGLLLWQRAQVKKQQGLNESGAPLPNFDEVWDASKFKFEDQEGGRAGGMQLVK